MDRNIRDAFETGNAQLFVGSGLSLGLYPSSDDLRKLFIEERIYINNKETCLLDYVEDTKHRSLEDIAEYYEAYKKEEGLMEFIRMIFGERKKPIDIHQDLWKLPNVRLIYTTNYDSLIEDAIPQPKQEAVVVTRFTETRNIDRSRRIVFKPHGCARTSLTRSDFVITRNDYLNYSYFRPLDFLKTIHDITSKTFIFLGYGLRDPNIRSIITEAYRYTNKINAYAVVTEANEPETIYWNKLNVTLIKLQAKDFIKDRFSYFAVDESEWAEKVEERIGDKEEIASKAIIRVKEKIKDNNLNIIIDAGSTALYFARALIRELKQNAIPSDNVSIISNSPPVISELSSVLRRLRNSVKLYTIGGNLRYATQALVSDYESTKQQVIKSLGSNKGITLSFIGVTSIDQDGLRTRTEHEVDIKKCFIDLSDEVYILADHSKIRALKESKSISTFIKDKMYIITDRIPDFDEYRKQVLDII